MAEFVTRDTFEELVLKSEVPVIVDFFAVWCGPCRAVGPILEEIAAERADTLKVYKLNIDEFPEAAQVFGVVSVPTMMMFEGGKLTKRVIGAMPKERLLREFGLK